MKDKVKNLPEKIYLQVGEESEGDFNTLVPGSVSWSGTRQNENDIEYCITPLAVGGVANDFLAVLVENMQAQIAGYYNDDKTDEERKIRNAVIEEYKDLIAIWKYNQKQSLTPLAVDNSELPIGLQKFDEEEIKRQLAPLAVDNSGGWDADKLIEIRNNVQWMWDNLHLPHTSDHFNIPANTLQVLDEMILGQFTLHNNNVKRAKEAAENIYRKINNYANPDEMRGIEKSWIITKIKEGLVEYASQSNSEVWSDEKIKQLLKWQINECALFVGRCAIGKRQSSHEINECIKSTPLIDFQPSPPKQ